MTDGLSKRGQALVDQPTMPPYLLEHFPRSAAPYHATDRPDGYIPLCIAENRLVWDLLEPKVNAPRDVPASALGYDDMVGSLGMREDLASFLGRHVFGREVAPEQLAVLNGAGTVLEVLFYLLADPNEGVLVPTPSYAGFWMDLETRDELRIVPVHARAEDRQITVADLDAAVASSDVPIRALLFTSPNNPLGTVYDRASLEPLIAWAEARAIHVVFDELYALSVFGEAPFVSVAQMRASLGPYVHVVWAFSKDFAASGLRVGVLFSENESLHTAVNGLAYWAACSGDSLHLLRSWLTDEPWLESYLGGMRTRLGNAYATVTEALTQAGIPYVPGGAGFFLLVDLRAFLEAPTFDAEDTLWRRLLDEANINLTPGRALRSIEPGLFRLCFASVDAATLEVALDRLVHALRA